MSVVRNRVKCKICRVVIESLTSNDFVECDCRSIAVFGGTDFLGRKGDEKDIIELSEEN